MLYDGWSVAIYIIIYLIHSLNKFEKYESDESDSAIGWFSILNPDTFAWFFGFERISLPTDDAASPKGHKKKRYLL